MFRHRAALSPVKLADMDMVAECAAGDSSLEGLPTSMEDIRCRCVRSHEPRPLRLRQVDSYLRTGGDSRAGVPVKETSQTAQHLPWPLLPSTGLQARASWPYNEAATAGCRQPGKQLLHVSLPAPSQALTPCIPWPAAARTPPGCRRTAPRRSAAAPGRLWPPARRCCPTCCCPRCRTLWPPPR